MKNLFSKYEITSAHKKMDDRFLKYIAIFVGSVVAIGWIFSLFL